MAALPWAAGEPSSAFSRQDEVLCWSYMDLFRFVGSLCWVWPLWLSLSFSPHQLSAPHLSNQIGTISRYRTVPQTQRVKKLPEVIRKVLQLGSVAVMTSLLPWAQRREFRTIFSQFLFLSVVQRNWPGLLSKVDNGSEVLHSVPPSPLALTKAISHRLDLLFNTRVGEKDRARRKQAWFSAL